MSTRAKTIVRSCAAASTASLVIYAFTGLHLWSPLMPGGQDAMRALVLALSHILPFFALIFTEGQP